MNRKKPGRPEGWGYIEEKKRATDAGCGGIIYIQYHDRGRRYRETTRMRGDAGRAAAERLLNERYRQIVGRKFQPEAERLTVRDLGKLLTDYAKANELKSARRIPGAMAHLEAFFGFTTALAIPGKIPAYIAYRREEKAAPATIALEIAALRRSFTLAVRAGLMASRPLIQNVRVSNARQGFIDEATFAKLVAALPEDLRLPIRFAFETAWRRGEWVALRWADVDLKAGEIRLAGSATKSGVGRVFPLVGAVKQIIEEQHAKTRAWERAHGAICPLVFWRETRNGARPLGDFRDDWDAARKKVGLPDLLIHDLRRSRARIWSNSGVPDRLGMALGGWATRSIYDRYGIVSKADLSDALERVARRE